MLRKKFYLTLNLLLGGSFLVTQGLTSCEAAKEKFSIFLTQNYDGGGIVKSDKTQGEVGETVKIEVELNDGYTVAHIKVNGEIKSQGVTTFEFQPVSGENKVEVVFSDEHGTIIDPGAKPIKNQFELHIILNGNHGVVEADKLKGKVGETVNVTINPDPGYEIESIEFNKVEYSLDTRTFTPVEGKNKLKVSFKKVEEVHYDWSLDVVHNEGGVVTPSAIQGNKDEKIEVEITLEPEYIVDKIIFNNKDFNVDTRLFTPVDGVNKLEVKFIHESALSKLDKGFELTGKLVKEHETDIKTPEEFIEVLNGLETFNNAFGFIHGQWEYSVNNHPEFATLPQKTGVTKKELLDADKIVFNGTLEKISQNKYDWSNKDDVKEIMTYFKNVYDNMSLPVWYTCVAAFYFGTTVIVNDFNYFENTNNFISMQYVQEKEYILEHYSNIEGVKEFVEQFKVDTTLAPKDNNYFDEDLQRNLYILCEFGYKLWGKIFAVTRDVDTIAKHTVTIFKFLMSGSFEGNEKEFTEACNLFGQLITEGFCNKDSFPIFLNALGFIDNMNNDNVAHYDLRGSSGWILTKYKELMPEITKDIHHLYRVFKFIGFIAKDITINELNFLKVLFNNSQDIKYSESFIHASKAFMRAYTNLGNEALLVKEAIPQAIEKNNYLFKNVFNSATFDKNYEDPSIINVNTYFTNTTDFSIGEINSNLNIDKILEEIENASKKDIKTLTEEDETYYKSFVESELLGKMQIENSVTRYALKGKTDYKQGDKLDLTLYKTEPNKETEIIKLDESKVKGFSTNNKKTDILIFNLDSSKDIAVSYTVDNLNLSLKLEQEGEYNELWNLRENYLPLDFDSTSLKFKSGFNGVEINIPEILGVDRTKTGRQYVAIKYNEQFLFGTVYLYDPKDVINFTCVDDFNVPLNKEIDLKAISGGSVYNCKAIYVDEKFTVFYKIRKEDLRFLDIVGINGTNETKYTFNTIGLQKLNVTITDKDIESKQIELTFNAREAISYSKSIHSRENEYYSFIGATRFEDKVLDFTIEENYDFGDMTMNSSYRESRDIKLTANDFDNKLDYTKMEINSYGEVTDYYQGIPYEFRLYRLKQEYIDKYFLGNAGDEFAFVYGFKVKFSDTDISKGILYVYEDYQNPEYVSTVFKQSEYISIYDNNSYIDTSFTGEGLAKIDIKKYDNENLQTTTESIEAIYNVVKPYNVEDQGMRVDSNISVSNPLNDDYVLNVTRETKHFIYLPYSKRDHSIYVNELIEDITFKDIKDYIDYSYPLYEEQEITILYHGEKVKLRLRLTE